MPKKKLIGIIVSDKMEKTAVVRVEKLKEHPKYKRRFKTHKNYKADFDLKDGETDYKEGDKVVIEECRPVSKDKNWKIIKKF
jgi:small subunit ribosomal protein S17